MVQQAMRKTLGRGLSSLLDDIAEETPLTRDESAKPAPAPSSGAHMTPIEMLKPSRNQPRKYFDDDDLRDLTESIRARGVIQPILVRPLQGAGAGYEIVAGERRWRAAQRAKLHEVPIVVRELSDVEALEIAIIENIQRADLNPMEEAYGYRQLIEKHGHTQEELAKTLGKSRSHIANMMRLMNLPDRVQDLLRTGELAMGSARPLLGIDDAKQAVQLAEKAAKRELSSRQVEKLARHAKGGGSGGGFPGGRGQKSVKDANTLLMEGDLRAALRMPVTIAQGPEQSGELIIAYRDLEELERLCQLLSNQREDELEPVFASG